MTDTDIDPLDYEYHCSNTERLRKHIAATKSAWRLVEKWRGNGISQWSVTSGVYAACADELERILKATEGDDD